MDREVQKSRDYFSKRAARYALALKQMPHARILDLLPYVYVFKELSEEMAKPIRELEVMDAFGGTGFLSHALMDSGMRFTVGDACLKMLSLGQAHADSVAYEEVLDNFERLSRESPESQDCVVCHGGLHHVLSESNGTVDEACSKGLQADTVSNLSRLLRPGGALVIADVAARHSRCVCEGDFSRAVEEVDIEAILGRELTRTVKSLGLGLESCSLEKLTLRIRDTLRTDVNSPVPRYFFDEFVAKQTELGHIASFRDKDELILMGQAAGMSLQWAVDYQAPWLFDSRREAGWYFREKFSCGQTSLPGVDESSELAMAEKLERYLGAQELRPHGYAVNWGVNYVCFIKLC